MQFTNTVKKQNNGKTETSLSHQNGGAFSSSHGSHAEIKQRAESIYHSRNGGPGDELSDWLRAEQELAHK